MFRPCRGSREALPGRPRLRRGQPAGRPCPLSAPPRPALASRRWSPEKPRRQLPPWTLHPWSLHVLPPLHCWRRALWPPKGWPSPKGRKMWLAATGKEDFCTFQERPLPNPTLPASTVPTSPIQLNACCSLLLAFGPSTLQDLPPDMASFLSLLRQKPLVGLISGSLNNQEVW